MHNIFEGYVLNEEGNKKALQIAESFELLLERLRVAVPEGPELELVVTRLREACFHATTGMAKRHHR